LSILTKVYRSEDTATHTRDACATHLRKPRRLSLRTQNDFGERTPDTGKVRAGLASSFLGVFRRQFGNGCYGKRHSRCQWARRWNYV